MNIHKLMRSGIEDAAAYVDPMEEVIDLEDDTPPVEEETQAPELTEEDRRAIALDYAMRSGEFVPRSMIPEQTQPTYTPQNDVYDPLENESTVNYVRRVMNYERAQMRQEVLKEASSMFGVGAHYGASEHVVQTIKSKSNIPDAAMPYLREIVPGLLQANPALAQGLDENAIRHIRQIAIGRAFEEGKLATPQPTTQREPGFGVPSGMRLAPGITQETYDAGVRSWQELRNTTDKPTAADMERMGFLRKVS